MCLNLSSVNAYAADKMELSAGILQNSFILNNTDDTFTLVVQAIGDGGTYHYTLTPEQLENNSHVFVFPNEAYNHNNAAKLNYKVISIYNEFSRFQFDYFPNLFDYYVLINLTSTKEYENLRSNPFTMPSPIFKFLYQRYNTTGFNSELVPIDTFFRSSSFDTQNYSIIAKLPFIEDEGYGSIPCGFRIELGGNYAGDLPANLMFDGLIIAVSKGTNFEDAASAIVAAINNQTSELGSQLSGIANQLSQSEKNLLSKLDEIYSKDVDVSELNSLYDMVLPAISQQSETLYAPVTFMEEFVGLFNETPPEPVLTVPPLSMKIKGTNYQFFNGYTYNLKSMEQGPLNVLIQAMRTAIGFVLFLRIIQFLQKTHDDIFKN